MTSGQTSIFRQLANSFQFKASSPVLVSLLTLATTFLLYLVFVPPKRLQQGSKARVVNSFFGGLGAIGFFGNRYTFLNSIMTKDPKHPHHGIAKFNLLGKVVYHVGTTDEETIKTFALNRDLSFSQGNTFLFAGIPGAGQKGLKDGEMDAQERREMKELAQSINPRRLTAMTPVLAEKACENIEEWLTNSKGGSPNLIDLQQKYYPIIFQYTCLLMGMAEYASDRIQLNSMMKAFWATQMNAGFFTTLLPWLPQPKLIKRLVGAVKLWNMVRVSVGKRIKEGRREDDFCQELIDQGHSNGTVSRWVIGGLIAGTLNTLGTGAYVLAFVGADPALKSPVLSEIDSLVRRSCEARGDVYEDLSPKERLTKVKIDEWESGCELLYLCFRESIRFLLTNSLNRYYPGPQLDSKGNERPRLKLMGHEIEDDSYVVFSPPSNLHDEGCFKDPFKFDPMRYKRGEGTTDWSFVGWGVGNHKCTGMRFAKLETVILLASIMHSLEFTTVNDQNVPYGPNDVPLPDLSQLHWRSPRKPMRIRIERRRE